MASQKHKDNQSTVRNTRLVITQVVALVLIFATIALPGIRSMRTTGFSTSELVQWAACLLVSLVYCVRISAIPTTSPHTLVPIICTVCVAYGRLQQILPLIAIIALICLSVSYRSFLLGAIHTVGALLSAIPAILLFRGNLLALHGAGESTLDINSFTALLRESAIPMVLAILGACVILYVYSFLIGWISGLSTHTQLSELSLSRALVLSLLDILVLFSLPLFYIFSTTQRTQWVEPATTLHILMGYTLVLCIYDLTRTKYDARRKFVCLTQVQRSSDEFLNNPTKTALQQLNKSLHGLECQIVEEDESSQPLRAQRESTLIRNTGKPFRFVISRGLFSRPFVPSDALVLQTIAAIVDEHMRVQYAAENLHDITEADVLTGALSYPSFIAYLQRLSTDPDIQNVAIIYINIDRFKQVNDNYGHVVGNKILHLTAKRIREALVDNSILSRVNGDEFAVTIVNYQSRDDIDALANAIREHTSIPTETEEGIVSLSVSTTISIAENKERLRSLSLDANNRMYHAHSLQQSSSEIDKSGLSDIRNAGNTVIGTSAISASEIVQHAIQDDTIVMVYQPIYSLETNTIIGLEAQVRIIAPQVGTLPNTFIISEAKRLGLSAKLAILALSHSLEDMKRFRDTSSVFQYLDMRISGEELQNCSFLSFLEEAKNKYGDISVGFDVGGETLRTISDEMIASMNELTARSNYRIGLSHMGTDFSELRSLTRIPATTMRIGSTLFANSSNEKSTEIITKLVVLGREVGIATVFDDVTTPEQLELLQEFSGRFVQGSLFGNPVTAEELQMRLDSMGTSLPVLQEQGSAISRS